MDFIDSLKDIKKELEKEQDKQTQSPKNNELTAEKIISKEQRLQNEFEDFIKECNIKKTK